jgi:hypothetical protein
MNVELLLEDLVELNAGEIDYPVSSSLDETINSLQKLVSNPQDTNTQQSFAKSLGLALLHKSRHEDSLYESSVITGGYEQLDTYEV